MSINEYLKQQQPSTLDRYLNGQQRQSDKHARVAEAIEAAQAYGAETLDVHSIKEYHNPPEYQSNDLYDVGASVGGGLFRAGAGIVGLADMAQEAVGNSTLGHTVRSAANYAAGGEFAAPARVQRGQLGKFVEDNIVDLKGIAETIEATRSDEYLGKAAAVHAVAERDGILAGMGVAIDNPSVIVNTIAGSLPSMFAGGAVTRGLNGVAGAVGLGAQAAKTMSVNAASRAAAQGVTNGRVAAPAVSAAVGEGAIMAGSAREDIRSDTNDGLLTEYQAQIANAIGVLGAGTGALGGRITRGLGGRDIDDIVAGTTAKGAARTLLGGGAGIVVEAGEEALQSTFETVGKNMAFEDPLYEDLNTNVALGILSGGAMGTVASLGSAAPVVGNAVRKSAAKVTNAVKDTTFEEYANPENTKYSPTKAYESIKADLGSTDDSLRTAAEEKLASLDTVLAERKAQLTTTVDNMQQIIQGTLDDDGSIALPEEHAEYTQRLKVVQDELKRVQADTLDYEAAKAKHAERLRQAEGGTTVKAVEAEISTPKATGEDVVQSVAELHAQITDAELARLVATNSKVLDEVQGTAFRLLADAKISENAIKGISEVSKEVLNGKKGSTAETSNRGTREYEAIVMNGIRKGNAFAVESALGDLQSWTTNYVGKSAAASEALRIVREARSTPNSGIDPVKGVQVLPDENNTWRIVTNPAEHVPEKTRKDMGGLRIHQGSTKFVKEVGLNAQHVTNVNNALAAMAEASGLSQGIQTSETVEPTTNAESMDPPSVDATPTPDVSTSPMDQSSSKTYTDKVVATRSGKPVHMQINRDSNGDVESIVAIAETSSKPLPEIFQGTDAEVISQAIKRFPKVLAAASKPTPKKVTPAKKSGTPTTADTLNGIKYNTKYDLSKSLDKLVEAFGTPKEQDAHLVPLIKEFIKMLPGVKVQVFSSLEEASKHNKQWDAGNPGIYSTGSKTVLLHPNHTSTDVDMLTVLAHELAHGITTSMRKGQLDLHVSSSVHADLAAVHNVLKEYLAANKDKLDPKVADRIEYALSRPMELIAVGISEKPVREILDSIPMKDSKQSVFSKLISIAAEIFGITPKSHSALETLVRATGNAYKEQFPKEFAAWSKEVNVKTDTVTLQGKSPYLAKDQAKANKATKFIGKGVKGSSTHQYAKDFGNLANTGEYTSNDVVFVSVNGKRSNRVKPDFTEIDKAILAEATILTDSKVDRNREFNVGEREVADYLVSKGYKEDSLASGTWNKAAETVKASEETTKLTHLTVPNKLLNTSMSLHDPELKELVFNIKGKKDSKENSNYLSELYDSLVEAADDSTGIHIFTDVDSISLDHIKELADSERYSNGHTTFYVRIPELGDIPMIYIDLRDGGELLSKASNPQEVIIHEIHHAITKENLESSSEIQDEINNSLKPKLVDHISKNRERLEKDAPRTLERLEYMLSSTAEFLTVGTTEYGVIQELKKISVPEEKSKAKTSMFTRLVQLVGQFVGIPNEVTNVYEKLLDQTAQLKEQAYVENQGALSNLTAASNAEPYTPDTSEVTEYTLTEEETAALAVDGSLGINPPKAEVVAEKAKPVAERNILKAHFTQNTEGNNPLVKVKDFLSVLKGNVAGITMQYMPPKYRISNAQVAHLQDFTEFATQFNDTLQKVFIERPDAYKFQDLVQFLGKDNENVNTSMAASAYSWFLQNAGNVYNDDEGIAAALHLPEGTRIPKFVRDMYKTVGQQEAAVVGAFGSKAYSILQLKADKASDARYQSRMEASMGNLIYATLLDMGLVAKVERKLFEHEKALKGIDVFNKSRHLEDFNASKAANGISKHTTFNYVRPVRNMQTLELNPRIEQMLERSKESKGILSTLFSNSIGVQFPTFEKPKGFGQTSIPRTKSVPSSLQADLVKQSQQDGFKIRTGDAKVFETLYASDKEFLHKLGGIEATDEALSSVHIAKRDDALAAAKNAQRVLDNAIDFLTMAKNEDGTYKEFWDTQHLASNSRMHYDAGGFNVQSHQTHRILAGLSSFETEVDISVFKEDELTVDAFVNEDGTPTPLGVVFLSFAENFEGMENVKMFTDLLPGYDFHTWDKVPAGDFISAMMQYMAQDYIQDAIGSVQNLLEGKELSKEEKASIQSVVDEGGMGYQSLHALTSMAQLYTAIQEGETSYTTSVGIGSDGINNGVAIANLQAGTASTSMRLQTGIIPRTRKQELKSYQDTKRAGVPDYYTEFASQMDDGYKALTPTPKLEATRALFPSFGKRKGAKAWTIPFNYNAGFAKLRLALSNQLLDDIYGQMTKIAKLTNEPKDSVKYAEGMEMYKTFQTRLTTAGITVKLPEPQKLNDWDFGMTPSGEIDFTAQWKIMDQIMTAAEPFGEVTEAATNAMAEKYIVARNRDVVVQKAAYEVYEFLRGKVEAKFMQDMIASGKLPKGTTRLSYDSLSTEDLARLEKALIPYGPYLRTALSANSDNDLAGGVYLGQVEQFISQAERVQTKAKVKGKDVYLNTGIKSTREMDRGVGGLALQVQSGDATVSAHTKAKAHAIGVHDADIGSPKNIDLVGKVQNETFLDMMINYDAKGETFETLLRTLQGLSDLKTEYGITDKEIATLKKQLLGDADAKSIQDSKISKFLTEQGVATQSLEEALSVLGHAAYNADMQRLDIIKDTYAVQQYGWEGSERIVTDADRKLIEQRKKEIVKKANGLDKKVADIFNGPSSGTNITNKVVQNTRTLTDLQKWFGERLDKEISVSEVISEVSKEADAFGKTVLKMITPLIPKDVKVVYFNMENIPDGAKSMREDDLVRTRGWFNASTGTIYIKSVDAPNSRVNATTLIHELLHGAVAQRLYGATSGQSVEGKEAVDKLNALRTQLRETFKGNPAIERMTKNLDEFISYGLTESELQQKMQDIMVPRGNRTQGIVSMFKAFLGDLITILGFTNYRGKQVSMLQAFVTDSTQLLEAISVIPPVAIPMELHTTTDQVVSNLEAVDIFNNLPEGNVSKAHSKYLTETLDKLLQGIYKNQADARKNFTNIQVGAMAAENAGFSMSDRESYAVEAIRVAMDYYVNTHADTAMLTHIRKVYDAAKATLSPEDFTNVVWANASLQEKQLAQSKYNYLFKTTGNDYLSRFTSMVLGNEHLKTVLDVKLTEPSKKKSTWFEKLADVLSYVINSIDGKVAGAGLRTTGSKRLHDLVTSLSHIDARGRQKYLGIIDSAWSAIGMATAPLNNRGAKVVAKTLDNNFLKQSRFRILRLVGKAAAISADENLNKLPENIKKLRDQRLPNTRLGDMSEILNEVIAPNALRKMMDKFIRQASSIQQERQNIVDNTKKVVLGLFTNNGADLTKADHDALTYMLLRTDVQSLLNYRSEKGVMTLLEDPISLNRAINDITKSITTASSRGATMVNQAEMLGYYMVTGKGGNGLVKNAKGIADGLGTKSFVKDSAGVTLINQLDQLATLYALKHSSAKHKTAVKKLLSNERNGVRGMLKLHNDQVTRAKADFATNPYSINKGYVPDISNPNREINFIEDLSDREAMEKMGWVFLGEVDRDPGDKSPKRYLMVHNDKGYQRWVSGAVDLQTTNRKGTEVFNSSDFETLTLTKDRLKQDIPKFNPLKAPQGLIASYDADGLVVGYSYEMSFATRDEYLERSNNFADLLSTYEGSLLYKPTKTKLNSEVLKAIHKDFKDNYKRNPNAYIELSPTSSDPELVKTWRMLPYEFRQEAMALYGKGQPIIMNNEILNATVGFRKYSIATIWDKDKSDRNQVEKTVHAMLTGLLGANAQGIVAKYGHLWGELVTFAKDAIVIRSLSVLVGNMVSNILLLGLNDVNPVRAVREVAYATRHARAYQDARNNIIRLEKSKAVGGNLIKIDDEINKYQDIINRNPLKEFIEAGMLSSIVEDTMIQQADYTYMSSMQAKVNQYTSRVPKQLQEVMSWMMISPSTPIYQTFATVTQYSDFTAKYSLYKARMEQGLSHEAALAEASESFINYDMPTSKGLQYANDIGLFMFTKFFLRFQHIMMKKLETKAASTIGQHFAVEYFTGLSGVLDPLMLNRIGNNPFESGALGVPDAIKSIVTVDAVL